MSRSPFFYIEKFNHKTNEWVKVDVYSIREGEYKEVDLWPWNGTHDLFSILGSESLGGCPEFEDVHYRLPINVSDEMQKIFESHCDTEGTYTFVPEVKWFNLADAKLYLMRYPQAVDADAMEDYWAESGCEWQDVPKKYMPNPIKGLIDRVEAILEMWDWGWNIDSSASDVRVIFWIY